LAAGSSPYLPGPARAAGMVLGFGYSFQLIFNCGCQSWRCPK